MKKVYLLILVSIVLLLAFTSCDALADIPGLEGILGDNNVVEEPECEHEWTEATCMAPKTCTLCGEREGSLLTHNLLDATCTEAKTCTQCKQTWGEPLGHRWSAGSCTVARTCRTCDAVEGEAPGHDYADATCQKPMTCRFCSATEGEALGHKYVSVVTEPTCTNAGNTTYTCVVCQDSYVEDIKPALGHLNDVVLPAVDAACTEDGYTEGVRCSRCGKDTTPQNVIEATGHKSTSVVVDPTCTEQGYIEYTCSVCGHTYTGSEVPALGHDYGNATCGTIASCQRPGCSDANAAKPIEHDWAPATCTEPMTCKRCNATDEVNGPAHGHEMAEASCLAPKSCIYGCGLTEGEKDPHVLTMDYSGSELRYICTLCQSTFKVDNHYVLDGSSYDGMTPTSNKGNFTTQGKDVDGVIVPTDNPLIVEDGDNKYYQLLKTETTSDPKQIQIWVPKEDKTPTGFSSANNAVGFFSFKINAYMTDNFTMTLIDASASPDRWGDDWCIKEKFFNISPPTVVTPEDGAEAASESGETAESKTLVTVTGWNSLVLKTIDVTDAESKFTGWMDVIIGIVLNADNDTVTMYYYIDGEYVGNSVKTITTISNAFNCVYISGNTKEKDSGILIDDIAFGYTVAGYWCFDGHDHDWKASEVVSASCTTDGYTLYECECGCTLKDDVVVALGHLNDMPLEAVEATCTKSGLTAGVHCSRCVQDTLPQEVIPALGHTPNDDYIVYEANCNTDGYTYYTCVACGIGYERDYVLALGHDFGPAKCEEPGVCLRDNCGYSSGDEPIGHDYAASTCTTPATCKREGCGATYGKPRAHRMTAATCTSPATCSYGCGYTEGTAAPHALEHKYVKNALNYYCSKCNATFIINDGSFLNGNNHNGMAGAGNSSNYTVATGSENPLIVSGHYELTNKTGNRAQMQLWLPTGNPHSNFAGFTLENNAIGFLSFKISSYIVSSEKTDAITIKVTDNTFRGSGDFSWSNHTIDILTIKPAEYSNGVYTTKYVGHGGKEVVTVTSKDKFADFIDIKIGMQLTKSTGQLTLYYYVDGTLVTNYSVTMPIKTNKMNSVYISGYSEEYGSGIKFDDFAFGYTTNAEWLFDAHNHNYTSETVSVTCTTDGYTMLTCQECGHVVINDVVVANGHVEGEAATCSKQAVCSVCEQSYGETLPHTLGKPASCTEQAVCKVCEQSYGETTPHTEGTPASCTEQAVCKICEQSYGSLAGHTPSTPICEGDTTCSECGAELAKQTHSLEAVRLANTLKYVCVHCDKTFTTEKHYFFDGTDTKFTNFVTADENNVFNGDKSSMVINKDGQYEFIHDDNNNNGKGVVWIPKNSGGASMFDGFTTENNATGIISFKINSYMTETLALQFVDTSLRGVASDFWKEGSISEGFFTISPPQENVVTIGGWAGELMKIEVTGDNKWTGWIDVKIGVELSSADDTVTVHYYINGEYITSATRAMSITTDTIDGLYFNGRCNTPGGGYMLDDIGFGYSTKEAWIFDKK